MTKVFSPYLIFEQSKPGFCWAHSKEMEKWPECSHDLEHWCHSVSSVIHHLQSMKSQLWGQFIIHPSIYSTLLSELRLCHWGQKGESWKRQRESDVCEAEGGGEVCVLLVFWDGDGMLTPWQMVWGENCVCVWLHPSPPPHFKVSNQLKAS